MIKLGRLQTLALGSCTPSRYQKKDGKSNGVMALMDMMVGDLKTEHSEA